LFHLLFPIPRTYHRFSWLPLVRKFFINRIGNIQTRPTSIISMLCILKFNFGGNRNNFKFQFGFECFWCDFTFDYEPKRHDEVSIWVSQIQEIINKLDLLVTKLKTSFNSGFDWFRICSFWCLKRLNPSFCCCESDIATLKFCVFFSFFSFKGFVTNFLVIITSSLTEIQSLNFKPIASVGDTRDSQNLVFSQFPCNPIKTILCK